MKLTNPKFESCSDKTAVHNEYRNGNNEGITFYWSREKDMKTELSIITLEQHLKNPPLHPATNLHTGC